MASFVVQAPELHGHDFLVREVAGGWQVSGVVRLQSGGFFHVQSTSLLGLGTVRADRVSSVPVYINSHAGLKGFVKRTAFIATPRTAARFGNSGNGQIIGSGLAQTDPALSKFFPVTERVRVKFQADFFNVLNRTNFSGVNLNASKTNFGTISGAYPRARCS